MTVNEVEAAAEARLEEFRQKVRKVAIRVAAEQEWCDSGLNGVLMELGLPEKKDIRIPVEATTRRLMWVTVPEADTEDEALALVRTEQWQGANLGQYFAEVRRATPKDPDEQVSGDLDTTYAEGHMCRHQNRRNPAWRCTRIVGHGGRQHIAGNTEVVIQTWPVE